jgi:hypothetical protein
MKAQVMLVFALCVAVVHAVVDKRSIDLIDGKCITDSSCKSNEFCDRDLLNPFGLCKVGHEEGHACLFDSHCASKQCSFFRCKKPIMVKDGPC